MDRAAMSQFFAERLKPILAEGLDGYVLMGYAPTEDGRQRVVLYSDGKDTAMQDALAPLAALATAWAAGGQRATMQVQADTVANQTHQPPPPPHPANNQPPSSHK